jgi:flagellar hook assembly protein FlgD
MRYELEKPSSITIEIFDITGRKIKTVKKGIQLIGKHVLKWNLRDNNHDKVPSGIYLIRFVSDSHSEAKQVIVVR